VRKAVAVTERDETRKIKARADASDCASFGGVANVGGLPPNRYSMPLIAISMSSICH